MTTVSTKTEPPVNDRMCSGCGKELTSYVERVSTRCQACVDGRFNALAQQMASVSDYAVATAMSTYGGSFARHLASAAMAADEINLGKLKAAFPELWAEYGELATVKKLGGAGR